MLDPKINSGIDGIVNSELFFSSSCLKVLTDHWYGKFPSFNGKADNTVRSIKIEP